MRGVPHPTLKRLNSRYKHAPDGKRPEQADSTPVAPQVQFDLVQRVTEQIASELSAANEIQGGPEQTRLVRGRAETESTSSTEARRFCASRGARARAKREAELTNGKLMPRL